MGGAGIAVCPEVSAPEFLRSPQPLMVTNSRRDRPGTFQVVRGRGGIGGATPTPDVIELNSGVGSSEDALADFPPAPCALDMGAGRGVLPGRIIPEAIERTNGLA